MSAVSTKTLHVIAILAALGAASAFTKGAIDQSKADTSLKDRIVFGIETSALIRRYDIDVTVTNGEIAGSRSTYSEIAQPFCARKPASSRRPSRLTVVVVIPPFCLTPMDSKPLTAEHLDPPTRSLW